MRVETLAENLLFSTVRIEASGSERDSIGTGFVFAYESELMGEGRAAFFMVTNKHVIRDASNGSFVFIKADDEGNNPVLGHGVKIPIMQFEDHWHGHPNDEVDVAVMYLNPINKAVEDAGELTYVRPIAKNHITTQDVIDRLDAVEEILFIGYPDGLYDEANLTPIIRRGSTATPLQLDYGNEPAFLIDASVFPGSSGSPVFIANFATYMNRRTGEVFAGGSRTIFLGILSASFFIEEDGQIERRPIPMAKEELVVTTEQMIDLGYVYKASTITETIEDLFVQSGAPY
jgi:S1-C subfamily serine protease